MSDTPNTFEDFYRRFEDLVNEGKKYGIESVVIVMDNDPLKEVTVMKTVRHGHFYGAIGAMEQLKYQMITEDNREE